MWKWRKVPFFERQKNERKTKSGREKERDKFERKGERGDIKRRDRERKVRGETKIGRDGER